MILQSLDMRRNAPRFTAYSRAHAGHRAGSANAVGWDVPELCRAYHWPQDLAGGGRIGIVSLGGNWDTTDMLLYFRSIGQPHPRITSIPVNRTPDRPGIDEGADREVTLDIQIAAASYAAATGKPATIRVYEADITRIDSIALAVRRAAADGCDVCSISWGTDEANWGADAAAAMEAAAIDATQRGMIVLACSGDNNASDGGTEPANVDLPASCPHVIACGGTRKTLDSETVWNDDLGRAFGTGTGGGYSRVFERPVWQARAPHDGGTRPMRMVPDVAGNADPATGCNIFFYGAPAVVGGTSIVAPLYAGLFAAFGCKLGWIGQTLWDSEACFNDILDGDNGMFRALPGPDACSGLGSPNGGRLADLLLARQVRCGSAR